MRLMRMFLRLSAGKRMLLVKSALVVGSIRIALWILPFRVLRDLPRRMKNAARAHGLDSISISDVAWAVRVSSRCVPFATCLTQALAAQVLMARLGHQAHLRIGVAKSSKGSLKAHAWVECAGIIVIGRVPDISLYKMLSHHDEETA